MSANVMLFAGAGLVLAALTMALSMVGVLSAERRGVGRSLAAIQALDSAPSTLKTELEQPFSTRVVAPLGEKLVGIGRKLVRAGTAERIQRRLDIAGNPVGWDVSRIIGLKVAAMAGLGGFGLFYSVTSGAAPLKLLVVTAGAAGCGYVLPNVLLYNAGQKREALMRRALPDALDLLTISVEAGLGFDAALMQVARNTKGPLAQEFSRLLQEMQIGVGRSDAMRAMAERSTIAELKTFCMAMVQADSLGIPVAKVLRVQSKEMRVKRRQRAEEKAQQVPVKIMVPLVLFILPSLFTVIMGPAVLRVLEAMK
ncbi:type II secretion system F family protein [Nocardioides sp. LS1]|uniref:type II secretion system F family protein n=1 Tax=Nocardioides sp. LS1 TaxID=1027620 RepID=UPI000F61E7BC|nr:type II secretion system F family protein [Nocardioides sp. LS1]GCD88940.1 type II secretion system protein [Nocardioides sp. LS1]